MPFSWLWHFSYRWEKIASQQLEEQRLQLVGIMMLVLCCRLGWKCEETNVWNITNRLREPSASIDCLVVFWLTLLHLFFVQDTFCFSLIVTRAQPSSGRLIYSTVQLLIEAAPLSSELFILILPRNWMFVTTYRYVRISINQFIAEKGKRIHQNFL